MKYIAVAFVATVNKNTISMGKIVFALKYKVIIANSTVSMGKIVFALKYKVINANSGFQKIKWFLCDSFYKKNLSLISEAVR